MFLSFCVSWGFNKSKVMTFITTRDTWQIFFSDGANIFSPFSFPPPPFYFLHSICFFSFIIPLVFDLNHEIWFARACSNSGEGNGSPLQGSCLESLVDRGSWGTKVHGFSKSWTGKKRVTSGNHSNSSSIYQVDFGELQRSIKGFIFICLKLIFINLNPGCIEESLEGLS